MASRPTISSTMSTTSTIRRSTRPGAGRGDRAAARPQVHPHQRLARARREGRRARSASPTISRTSSTSCAPSSCPSPTARPMTGSSPQPASSRTQAAMFEDLSRNLAVPKALGMATVLVVPGGTREVFGEDWESEGRDAEHVDYLTDDLGGFLERCSRDPGGFDLGGNLNDSRQHDSPPIDHRRGLRGPRQYRRDHQGSSARRGGSRSRPPRPRRNAGGGEAGRGVAGQSVAQEGGAPLLPAQPDVGHRGRTGGRRLVGQGAVEIRRLGERRTSSAPASAPCPAPSSGAPPTSRRGSC